MSVVPQLTVALIEEADIIADHLIDCELRLNRGGAHPRRGAARTPAGRSARLRQAGSDPDRDGGV